MTADEIKKLRKKLGLSQEEFGAKVGVTGSTIANWESEQTKPSKMAQRNFNQYVKRLNRRSKI